MRKSTTAQKDEENGPSPALSPGPNARQQQQQQQQQSGSYSSIVGSFQTQNGTETRTARGDNPFKYGKDEMMQVYSSLVGDSDKMTHTPLDFERYEQVTSPVPVHPSSMNDLTEDEKALLAGNINSEQKVRRPNEANDARQNGRRDNRQNGSRDTKKHPDTHRNKNGDAPPSSLSNGRVATASSEIDDSASRASNKDSLVTAEDGVDGGSRESFSQLSGRQSSRLSTMGVFDTGLAQETNAASKKWKDEKDDETVLKEAMGSYVHDSNKQDIDRLAEMYQNQSLGSGQQQPSQQTTSRNFADPAYHAHSNGLPDIFSKTGNPNSAFAQGQPALNVRAGFMESTPSPGLQPPRQDQQQQQQQPMTARIMVMPDKLKWQYRDPTGQNQGPFSGLEMHDWYKAGFFQPNLLVKREEDEDFEPLSILVRRIGNQREPFLVPLPSRVTASSQPARPGSQDGKEQWPNGQNWSSSSGGQPPFPQSFPSFGTTLTAEQQNALERRKQEEQYLMHRQREFLQQQQMAQQMAAQRMLHHQHPYGQGGGGGGASFAYGNDRRSSPFSSGSDRQGSMASFDVGGAGSQGHTAWGGYVPQNQNSHRGQYTDFGAGIFDIPKSEVADQSFREPERFVESHTRDHSTTSRRYEDQLSTAKASHESRSQQAEYASKMAQQAQAMQKSAEAAIDSRPSPNVDSAYGKAELDNHSAYEPPQSSAVPTSAAEMLATPTTPAAAPWAAAASSKGRSLREIQELEAERDAHRRQAERRAAHEAQALADAQQASLPQVAPAVPLTLNWANEATNELVGSPGAAWKASLGASGKKTLAQIQREEESAAREKAAAQARALGGATTGSTKPVPALGTRYADTAMRPSASWSTVGTGGKVAAVPTSRAEVLKSVGLAPVPVARSKVVPVSTSQAVSRPVDPNAISPDFLNWARSALKGLNPGVNFAEFLQLLLSFGTDGGKDTREIISDSIYANSATLDGRRFADEWSKRRKEDLKNTNGQNKSISELTSTLASSSASANDWSDVVKAKPGKQENEEEWNSSFKVQAKKSGKRK